MTGLQRGSEIAAMRVATALLVLCLAAPVAAQDLNKGLTAAQGDPAAQSNLGLMYNDGQAVAPDYAVAVKWYRLALAAVQGDSGAQFNLGLMYANGRGVPQDFVQAYKWFNLAAVLATGKNIRNMAEKDRDNVARQMTPADVSKAQRLAREWMAALQKQQKK